MSHRFTSLAFLGLVTFLAGWTPVPADGPDSAPDATSGLTSEGLTDSSPETLVDVAADSDAASDPVSDPSDSGADDSGADDSGASGPGSASACGGRRWISYQDPSVKGACSSVAGFDAEPLFDDNGLLPASLAGYCLHTWSGPAAPTAADVSDFQSALGTADVAEDCTFVAPLGAYEDHLGDMLHGAVTQRIGVVQGVMKGGAPVHVAVIDTTPDSPAGVPVLGHNRHGDTLAALIGDVVQVPGATAISTTLAMPRMTDLGSGEVVYSPTGGDFGYLSDLSRAVWRAFTEHQTKHAGEHFVMNLSLGWEPLDKDSACAGNMLPAARAVRDVLDVAACKAGAVIVAAAGNDMGGPTPGTGLMCPATWMSTPPTCDAKRPLVVGAYGLDHSDAPIAISRANSSSPFAAPALGGIAWPAGAPRPSPLTGTSVSSAAVSASVAAVWAAAPEFEPSQVVTLLHEHGTSLGAPADTCAWGVPGCDVRRISPCGALSALGSPWTCESTATPSVVSNVALDAPTHGDFLYKLATTGTLPAASYAGLLPSELTPSAGGQNRVSPQPVIPTCPTCVVGLCSGGGVSNPVFYGSLDRSVSSLVLVATTSTTTYRYAISVSSWTTSFRATLPIAASATRSAWISATDASTGLSVVEQVLVSP
ncbi:MAG: S8 family serine peptidase [Polyangiaceae bacterium]